MPEIGNPALTPREKSPGELREEWASVLSQALQLFFQISITKREEAAISTIAGLIMREALKKGVNLRSSPAEVLKQIQRIMKSMEKTS